MSDFEIILACMLILIGYVLMYIAGKYDILSLICKALQEKVDENADTEKWKDLIDADPVEDLHQLIKDCEERAQTPSPCTFCYKWHPGCVQHCRKHAKWEHERKEKKDG